MVAPEASRRLSFKGRFYLLGGFFLALLAVGSLRAWSESHAFMINASDSLPNWAFVVDGGRFPERGDYVIFHPGNDPLTREYFGEAPSPFAKIAYGLPGDVISREDQRVLVNGEVIATLKPATKRGDRLTAGPLGVVPQGCVFAATPHKDGFDSRYSHIGFVCADRLVGVGEAIL